MTDTAFIIHPIRAFSDNYIWLIQSGDRAIVIDAGDSKPVLDFLSAHGLTLDALLVTHDHHDHIGGIQALQHAYPNAITYAHANHQVNAHAVTEGDRLTLLGLEFGVWLTPGHTDSHLSYLLDPDGRTRTHVFCGDTLFSGGCGRTFTGTIDELYESVQRFDTLPSATLFFPAHEYTLGNLRFGAHIEPKNTAIADALITVKTKLDQGIPSLPVSLAHERAINVFLRADHQAIKERLIKLGALTLPNDTLPNKPLADTQTAISARQVFAKLRALKNSF